MAKDPRLLQLEANARAIATKIKADIPAGAGFALFVFDYGPSGWMTYVSSAQREDMLKALREFMARPDNLDMEWRP